MRGGFKPSSLASIVLGAAAVAGICSLAILMPGIVHLVPKRSKLPSYELLKRKRLIRQALRRLERHKLIKGFIKDDGTEWISITQHGYEELFRLQLISHQPMRQKIWDTKWRMIVFDVKEINKCLRDRIRRTLHRLGFVRLQDSVWIFPFACEETFELIRAAFHIKHEAVYLTCERFHHDQWLCKKFNLLQTTK